MKGAFIEVEFQALSRSLDWARLPVIFQELEPRWSAILEQASQYGEFGQEKVQFLLSSNHGELKQPLHKIASGGEVSAYHVGD